MTICLFEDPTVGSLLPLTHLQAAFDLRCGAFTALERSRLLFPDAGCALYARPELAAVVRERHDLPVNDTPAGPVLFLNGRALVSARHAHALLAAAGSDGVFMAGDTVAACMAVSDAFRLEAADALRSGTLQAIAPDLPRHALDAPCVTRAWDLIEHNDAMLRGDAALFPLGTIHAGAAIHPGAWILQPDAVFVGDRARIGAGAVIDAGDGPVIIAEGADVMPLTVLQGPCYIGPDTRIKPGGHISASGIGPCCRIGGEVEGSIFHSYANKQHDGFVGHSYLAAWTNLGADTNTSDLKNNYSTIRATVEGDELDTGRRFLGTIMAEHSKCGINTMFNTGTVVGVGCNLFGGDFPPKSLPSFSWGGAGGLVPHEFARFAETAAIVMQRRGRTFTVPERDLCLAVYERTRGQRHSSGD